MIIIVRQTRLREVDRMRIMREVCISRDGPNCIYCGCDLLADAKTFATMALDHFKPKRLGGPDAVHNRHLACCACDKLKAGREFASLEDARTWLVGAYERIEAARLAFGK